MACLKVNSLNSAFMDLGTTVESLYFIGKHYEFSRLFTGHIQFSLLIFSIPYTIFNGLVATYIIIALQTIILLSPIFKIHKEFGTNATLIYLSNPIIYYLAFSTFHIDVLVIPLLYYFISFCNQKKYNYSLLFGSLITLVKESFAPISVVCGIYLLIKSKYLIKASLLILFSSFYFIASLAYVIPYFYNSNINFISGYASFGINIFDILINLVTNFDKFFLDILFNPLKIKFLILIIIVFPLAFIRFNLLIILSFPILIMLLSSSNNNYFSFGHHYIAPLLPIYIYITFINLKKSYKLQRYYLLYSVIICIALSPSPLSRLFFSSKIDNFNYASYISTERSKKISDILNNLSNHQDISIVISIQNNIFLPELHFKHTMLLYPSGVFKPMPYPFKGTYNENRLLNADYVVLDTKRRPFIYDKGCNYYYQKCTDLAVENEYNLLFLDVKKRYSLHYEYDGLFVFKR